MTAAHSSAFNPLSYGTIEYIEVPGPKPIWEVISFTHAMEFVTHNFGVAFLPRSASHLSHMGVLFKPISDRLLWIETALFLRQDQRADRLRWFVPELLLQIKNARLEQGGSGTLADVRQAEQLLYTAAAAIPDLERQIEQEENSISILLGRNPGPIVREASEMNWPQPEQIPTGGMPRSRRQ